MPDTSPPGQPWPIGFGATCLRATLYILFIGALAQGTLLEAQHLTETRFTELGFTELAQTTLLAVASALLLYTLLALKQMRTVCLLMFAFVFSSLIREQDALLDSRVFDGAWQLIVALVIVPTLAVVIRLRRRFVSEFSRYSNSFSFGLFAAGVLTTYVFSRLYGRSEMWEAILASDYTRTFKDAAEEVVELFGYALILIAVIELTLLARRWALARQVR
ncbi:hypothetical protein [Halomonas urumqiensis]|uniref:Uncharacterized protein n=1 Tax=Halomonas urumqiensis TaxID=1684789 RepID=A0A2N7UC62_9GAMM|nr:hypothetical protein [Halomonas urumqiensis]PMR78024.1 hypothetical protein C1H70_14655 [Halomonas urumqiensis]PTB03175.1 hypothetical protein C6V82_01290 [Halomonas urumqiensis]GHE20679.1 hypothetical protein GCM10017767_12000 [Halomonas urumqiensis]